MNDADKVVRVPVTWIICPDHQDDPQKIGRRLHAIGDDLHKRKTKMKEGRYQWAIDATGTVILCHDTVADYISVWRNIGEEDQWVVSFLRGAMKLARRKMT